MFLRSFVNDFTGLYFHRVDFALLFSNHIFSEQVTLRVILGGIMLCTVYIVMGLVL